MEEKWEGKGETSPRPWWRSHRESALKCKKCCQGGSDITGKGKKEHLGREFG